MPRRTVAVVGAGPWGVALAAAAARAAGASGETLLYSRRALGAKLPKGVTQARDFAEIGARARLLVLAVPSEIARKVAGELGDHLDGRHLVVHGVRGFAGESLDSISEVVRQETPVRRVGALGGPVLAEELVRGKPSVMVAGSPFPEVTAACVEAFASDNLRLYGTGDLRGLEWASALVGCLAIGVGYVQELGLGAGPIAAVTTRAVTEAAHIVEAAGGEARTMLGLAGYGDLLASIAQKQRPEILLGAALAQKASLDEAVKLAKLRVEAVELIPRIVRWAESVNVKVPILAALSRGIFTPKAAKEIMAELMAAPIEGSA